MYLLSKEKRAELFKLLSDGNATDATVAINEFGKLTITKEGHVSRVELDEDCREDFLDMIDNSLLTHVQRLVKDLTKWQSYR